MDSVSTKKKKHKKCIYKEIKKSNKTSASATELAMRNAILAINYPLQENCTCNLVLTLVYMVSILFQATT